MKKVLVVAPHADDEIIGVGGTLLKHIDCGDEVFVCIVTRGFPPLFPPESTLQTKGEAIKCHQFMGVKETIFFDFPTVMLETVERYKINDRFCQEIQRVKPDVVYIPHYGDMQKDHQIVVEASMVALRPKYEHVVKKVYAYETLSETGWNVPNIQNEFIPNAFVDISDYLDKKLDCLAIYEDQVGEFPDPRSTESVLHLARYRGALMGMNAAESFMIIRELN